MDHHPRWDQAEQIAKVIAAAAQAAAALAELLHWLTTIPW
jgi:hypothetical protein